MKLSKLRDENIEEYWNVLTHAFGAVLAFLGSIYLLSKTDIGGEDFEFPSVLIFCFSMLMVYIASAMYHYNWNSPNRKVYKTMDHITIYYLIAGTYSPFLLISYPEQIGWRLLMIIWILAFLGSIFKFFYVGRFKNLSLTFYILLGWAVLIDFKTFLESIESTTFYLIAAGGLLYCLGVIFYVRKAKFSHTIWHLFVIAANACHYLAILSIL